MIESAQNPQIKQLKQLITHKKWRDKLNLFTIETPKVIEEIIQNGQLKIETFYHTTESPPPERFSGNSQCVATSLLKELSHLSTPSGWIVTLTKPAPSTVETVLTLPSGVILDGVSDPSNVGAILRNCAAFDIGFVSMTPGTADLFHPESIRACAGHIPPYIHCDETTFKSLTIDRFHALACCPHATQELDANTLPPHPLFILGSEGQGIHSPYLDPTRQSSLSGIKLPMSETVESLNVSVTSGILFNANFQNRALN